MLDHIITVTRHFNDSTNRTMHLLAECLCDAARQRRRADAKWYSTQIILGTPTVELPRLVLDAVYHLGRDCP